MTKLTIMNENGQAIQVEADAFRRRTPEVENAVHDFRAGAYPSREARIEALVTQFNGAIKYAPMLQDHPDWSDDECLAFARKWHVKAIKGLRAALERDRQRRGPGHWHNPPEGELSWNHGVPYCRNQPTTAMLDEAMK